MKKILFALMGILLSVCANTAFGAGIAHVVGVAPAIGAVALNGVAVVSSLVGGIKPSDALCAGVYTEIWTGELIKAFRTAAEQVGWYNAIRNYDNYVKHDVIHFVDLGGDPTILVNNTTYPLEIESLDDGDKAVKLDKYQSKPTRITDDELHAISYDKMASVIDRHKEAFFETKFSRAIHAIAPAENTSKTPVILTSGAESDGRKIMTRHDIVSLKKKFDKAKAPKEGRILVLCADHVADLLENDQKFAQQYYNYESGRITKMYGFDIYEYDECPYFNVTTLKKVAYGAVTTDNDMQSSVAFSTKRVMRADGSTKSYLKEAANNPETQENLFSMRTYTICLPLKAEALGAIVSAKAA